MRRHLGVGLAALVVLAYPLITAPAPVYQRLGALVLLAAIGASAWNLIGGYAGQVSVGHAVFFGAGAYAATAAYSRFGLPPIAGAPVGALVAAAIAALIGVPTLRLSGHYFSMATIAVAELVRVLVTNWQWLGGAQGLSGPAVPRTLLDLSFVSAIPYYYLFLSVLAAILLLTWRIEGSRMGFYLRAIKDSERAARALGVAAGRYKLYALMLSAGLTALAGSLYAVMFGFVDPESGCGILISVKMLIMAALGGSGLLFGPLVGALILVPLEEISNSLLGGRGAGLTFVAYGTIIVIIARFLPSGILALLSSPAPFRLPLPEQAAMRAAAEVAGHAPGETPGQAPPETREPHHAA
jgi:branched-chain amino acid transport system permease protein